MKSDIEIAQEAKICEIGEIVKKLNIDDKYVERYGKYKAKIDYRIFKDEKFCKKEDGKLILVTAINPTKAGEGKTTVSVGLADALNILGKNAVLALREPSLGPVFGVKGGACGGGYSQVVPMEDINLHFTGDIHAVTTANNLIAAMIDNHIKHGNELRIHTGRIIWKRCMDMNDRQLRKIVDGLGGETDGVPREDGFDISVASEVMAVLCLSETLEDLKKKIGNMIVAYDVDDKPVTVNDMGCTGACSVLLKEALKPNLVQTLIKTPTFIHGGPFANIAHGCNSIMATKLALKMGEYAVTEAGFGADLGAEKFMDIKCRMSGISPDCVVIVATVRALKMHGGAAANNLHVEDMTTLEKGFENLKKHIENITNIFNRNIVVAINKFPTDTEKEIGKLKVLCEATGVAACVSNVFEEGGNGGTELAKKVIELASESDSKKTVQGFAYDLQLGIKEKIETLATKVYGASGVAFSSKALKDISKLEALGYGKLPICVAKTQYSISDDPELFGRPDDFIMTVRGIKPSAGAGFIVVLTGDIMTMPGLPQKPAAIDIDIDECGKIKGLF